MEERRSDSQRQESTVARAGGPPIPGDESDDEFEFSFGSREPATGDAAADELFADGRIRAFYPVFGRVFDDAHAPSAPGRRPLGRLFLEEARNSSVGSTSSSFSKQAGEGKGRRRRAKKKSSARAGGAARRLPPLLVRSSSVRRSKNAGKTSKEPVKVAPKEPIFTCPVCWNKLDEPATTMCGHIFCTNCIKQAIQFQKKCPTCRKHLKMNNFHRIYLPNTSR